MTFSFSKRLFFLNFLFFSIAIVFSVFIYFDNYVEKDFSNLELDNVNKLMIVAHPDDEVLWGGAHLIEDDYLVVCITCGRNKRRAKEFIDVMNLTNDKYVMLGYPDKVLGIRSDWKEEYNSIYFDLQEIILMKDWDLIVTHNASGEYGHIHHILSNKIVLQIFSDKDLKNSLYTFGKYYKKSKLKKLTEEPNRISEELLDKKKNLINIYKSQEFIKKMFGHMNPYENWEKVDFMISRS